MRSSIDTQSHLLKNVLLNPAMRKEFLKGVPAGNEGKAVKAFVEMNKENMLKTKPKVSIVLCYTRHTVFVLRMFFPPRDAEGGTSIFPPIVSGWRKRNGELTW